MRWPFTTKYLQSLGNSRTPYSIFTGAGGSSNMGCNHYIIATKQGVVRRGRFRSVFPPQLMHTCAQNRILSHCYFSVNNELLPQTKKPDQIGQAFF